MDSIKVALMILVACFFLSGRTECAEDIDALTSQALSGDIEAQFKLGTLYDWGEGVERSRNEAEKWYLMAGNNGYAEAQNSLGSGYQAEEDYVRAKEWYEKAAAQDHPLATNNLGYLYDLGLGVQQNRNSAFEYYLKAAELGWAESMWNIANMYGAGQLGDVDLLRACIWTFRAQKFKTEAQAELQSNLNNIIPYLEKQLGNEQFSTCQLEADNWQTK